jgi:O-6-methylguanine DNA methyltransferase
METYHLEFEGYYYIVVLDGKYVVRGYFSERPVGKPVAGGEGTPQPVSRLYKYFAGERVDFRDIGIRLSGIRGVWRRILEATREIGYGEVRSYKWVAERAGIARGWRLVGAALARNPITVIIPCHRVIRSDGGLGGYTSPGGVALKARLLALEGISLPVRLSSGDQRCNDSSSPSLRPTKNNNPASYKS